MNLTSVKWIAQAVTLMSIQRPAINPVSVMQVLPMHLYAITKQSPGIILRLTSGY